MIIKNPVSDNFVMKDKQYLYKKLIKISNFLETKNVFKKNSVDLKK